MIRFIGILLIYCSVLCAHMPFTTYEQINDERDFQRFWFERREWQGAAGWCFVGGAFLTLLDAAKRTGASTDKAGD